MDLSYICQQDIDRLQKLEELGCDLDALFFVAKDTLSLCDEMALNAKQSAEMLVRLKRAYDISQGKVSEPDLVLYENFRNNPTRLSVENKITSSTVFFRVDDNKTDYFTCETCNEAEIPKDQAKYHVFEKHNTS